MKRIFVWLLGLFSIIAIMYFSAIAHEQDMYNEYQHDKTLTHTSWITNWNE